MQFSLSGRHLCIPVLLGKSFIDKHFCIHPHKSRFVCSIKFILAAFKLAGGEQHFMLFADGKSTRDRRANVARGAAPCTERSDAKQPGHSGVRAKLRRTHILSSGEYKSVPFVPKGFFRLPLPRCIFQMLLCVNTSILFNTAAL